MSIGFRASGSVGVTFVGTLNVSAAQVGDLVVFAALTKDSSDPLATLGGTNGWPLLSPVQSITIGGGSDGVADDGTMKISVYTQVITGAETLSALDVTANDPDGGGALVGFIALSPTVGWTWQVADCGGSQDAVSDTSFTATGSINPGIVVSDWLVAFLGSNTDAGAWSAQTLAATGTTISNVTERLDAGTPSGRDFDMSIATGDVTAGTASAAPVATATYSVASEGGGLIVRVRQVPPPPLVVQDSTHQHQADSVNLTQHALAHLATPPTRQSYEAATGSPLWRFYQETEGVTWYKVAGVWYSGSYLPDDLVADELYRGGYEYEVDAVKAAELQALGFTIRTEFR